MDRALPCEAGLQGHRGALGSLRGSEPGLKCGRPEQLRGLTWGRSRHDLPRSDGIQPCLTCGVLGEHSLLGILELRGQLQAPVGRGAVGLFVPRREQAPARLRTAAYLGPGAAAEWTGGVHSDYALLGGCGPEGLSGGVEAVLLSPLPTLLLHRALTLPRGLALGRHACRGVPKGGLRPPRPLYPTCLVQHQFAPGDLLLPSPPPFPLPAPDQNQISAPQIRLCSVMGRGGWPEHCPVCLLGSRKSVLSPL